MNNAQGAQLTGAADQPHDLEVQYFRDPTQPTFPEIMRLLNAMDEGIEQFDVELHKKMLGKAQVKLDNYKRFIDTLDAEAGIVNNRIAELQAYKKRILKRKQGLEDLLLYLAENGQVLPGAEYDLKIKTSTTSVVKIEPSDDLYIRYPNLMRVYQEWKINDLKKYLKQNPKDEILKDVLGFETTKRVAFELRKGLDL